VKAGQNWTQNHAEKANTGAETDDTGPQEQQMVGALANWTRKAHLLPKANTDAQVDTHSIAKSAQRWNEKKALTNGCTMMRKPGQRRTQNQVHQNGKQAGLAEKANTGAETDDTGPQEQQMVVALAEKANTGAETDDTGPQEQQMVGERVIWAENVASTSNQTWMMRRPQQVKATWKSPNKNNAQNATGLLSKNHKHRRKSFRGETSYTGDSKRGGDNNSTAAQKDDVSNSNLKRARTATPGKKCPKEESETSHCSRNKIPANVVRILEHAEDSDDRFMRRRPILETTWRIRP